MKETDTNAPPRRRSTQGRYRPPTWRSLVVIVSFAAALAVYLFVNAPPPLVAEASPGARIPIRTVFAILDNENAAARALWTDEIVARGTAVGLRFDEHWRDDGVQAGPLPALFLRETARNLQRAVPRLGLFLGSQAPLDPANQFTGEQAKHFAALVETKAPEYFVDAQTGMHTARTARYARDPHRALDAGDRRPRGEPAPRRAPASGQRHDADLAAAAARPAQRSRGRADRLRHDEGARAVARCDRAAEGRRGARRRCQPREVLVASTDRSDRVTAFLGAVLIALYTAQGVLHLEWPLLAALQHDERHKVASGSVLAGFLLCQSLMVRRRVFDPVGVVFWHKLAGASAPLLLYLHAARFAYGYLALLSYVYLGTIGLGLLHRLAMRARPLYTCWFVLHLATASSLVVLSGYHAVIALAYE
jgi:hypothetical protein